MSIILTILRSWDDTAQRLADLSSEVSQLQNENKLRADENRLLVAALEGMAEEIGRMRESLHGPDTAQEQSEHKTVRRAGTWREFAAAARVAGKKA